MKHILLKGVERADAIGLGQTIVLAAVDDEHGSRPLVDEVDRVISARKISVTGLNERSGTRTSQSLL